MQILESLKEITNKLKITSCQRTINRDLWDNTLSKLGYIPVAYTNSNIDYQLAYQQGHGGEWHDISLILQMNGENVGVFPLSISIKDEIPTLSSHGLPILEPLIISDFSCKSSKKLVHLCLSLVKEICNELKIYEWETSIRFPQSRNLGTWYRSILSDGKAATMVKHQLYLDLRPSLTEIKKQFRNRYKSLINVGERSWQVFLLTSEDWPTWQEYMNLHFEVAGRKTRSSKSWKIQHDQIQDGTAFLVYTRDSNNRMLGGAFFTCTRDECCYGVGAYDRNMFDQPVSHVIHDYAIREMKVRNISWYRIGERFYMEGSNTPSLKEMSISYFKEGFSSHMFPEFLIKSHAQCFD